MLSLEPCLVTPDVERALQRVKDKTGERWTVPFVIDRIKASFAGLFHFVEDGKHLGYLVVERYDQGEVWMNVWVIEGEGMSAERMPEGFRLIDELARKTGASYWRCTGRKGWAKWLKPIAVVYEVDI